RTAEQMAIRFPAGLLVNLGEIPKSTYSGRLPSTRMGTASLVRQAFVQGQNQLRKRKAAEENPEARTSPRGLDANPKLDALAPYLQAKLPVFFKAHRADDLLTALRLAKEFELKPILTQATEGYLIADQLVQSKMPVLLHPTMMRPSTMET